MNYNLKAICDEVCILAKNVGNFINEERPSFTSDKVEVKGKNDFVSYVDKHAEQMIVKRLQELIPDAGFIVEEGTIENRGDVYNWIVDPLDGTTNFIHGLPCFAVSIALMKNDELVIGVIYEINLKECFYAWEGSKAYLNGIEITVSNTERVEDMLVATGFPYYDYSRIDEYMNLLTYFMKNTRGLRRMGSAATDLAYVACGRFDGFYEYCLQPWDVAAGAFIVTRAGGKVSDFKGAGNYLFGREIIAGNQNSFSPFQAVVNKHFY